MQEKSDRIVIHVEGERGASDIDTDVRSNCKSLFGDDVQIEIVHAPINFVKGRKHRVVTSKI